MKIFQVIKDQVVIVNEDKSYKDSRTNFLLDGAPEIDDRVIYDATNAAYVVNDEYLDSPVEKYDKIIEDIDLYVERKEKREYVEPKALTADDKKDMVIANHHNKLMILREAKAAADMMGNPTADIVAAYQVEVAAQKAELYALNDTTEN